MNPVSLTRFVEAKDPQIDVESRTITAPISSEYPVDRGGYYEILSHDPSAIRLDRLKKGPVCDSHDRNSQIGAVDKREVIEREIVASMRFSRHGRGSEIFDDYVDDIRHDFSIGYWVYAIERAGEMNGKEVYRVTDWEPFEVSAVSVPADPTVGVGREAEQNEQFMRMIDGFKKVETIKVETDEKKPDEKKPTVDHNQAIMAERARINDIYELGSQYDQNEAAREFVKEEKSADQFRKFILDCLKQNPTELQDKDKVDQKERQYFNPADEGLDEQELKNYSLLRAINACARQNWKDAGFEREVNLFIAEKTRQDAKGFYVPHAALIPSYRLQSTAQGVGGDLIQKDLRTQDFIEYLRNQSVVLSMGARVLNDLNGDVDIPKQTGTADFYWLGEDEDVNGSDMATGTVPLKIKTIAGALSVTRRLRKQSSRDIEDMMREDLTSGLALSLDKAMLTGDGVKKPLGIMKMANINRLAMPSGGVDWASVVEMETLVNEKNAGIGGMGYVTGAKQKGAAKSKARFAGTGIPIWNGDTVNEYQAMMSNQIPLDTWLFGAWSSAVVGMWGVVDLYPDTAAKAASDGLVIRVFQDADSNCRYQQSFTVLGNSPAQGSSNQEPEPTE